MPQFVPSIAKVASLSIPVSPAGVSCNAELYLTLDGTTKAVTSGLIPFVSTGNPQGIQLPIVMPANLGTYLARVIIGSGVLQLGAYQAIDNVVIALPNYPFSYGDCSGVRVQNPPPYATGFAYPNLVYTIINDTGSPITHTLSLWRLSYSGTTRLWYGPDLMSWYPSAVITLQPHSSTVWRSVDHEEVHAVFLSAGTGYRFFLQDELGNKSPEVPV